MTRRGPQAFEMTPREHQIEEFYLVVLSRAIQHHEFETQRLRHELKRMAEELKAATRRTRK